MPVLDQPIALTPKAAERVWGGRQIAELFGRSLPEGPIGESWEVHGDLEVARGPLQGRTLDALVREFGTELLGRRGVAGESFPLLTKWLDCKDWLSIQVHPDDALARELTGSDKERGKSEAWYVARRDADARLIHGLRPGVEASQLVGIGDASLLDLVREMGPDQGEILFTPAGTVHALGPGFLIYEIQQSSDLTYRLYDWGRDRPVHIAESGRCMTEAVPPPFTQTDNSLSCPYFTIESLEGDQSWQLDGETFQILAVVKGSCGLSGAFGKLTLAYGETVLLPANLGAMRIEQEGGKVLRIGLGQAAS